MPRSAHAAEAGRESAVHSQIQKSNCSSASEFLASKQSHESAVRPYLYPYPRHPNLLLSAAMAEAAAVPRVPAPAATPRESADPAFLFRIPDTRARCIPPPEAPPA